MDQPTPRDLNSRQQRRDEPPRSKPCRSFKPPSGGWARPLRTRGGSEAAARPLDLETRGLRARFGNLGLPATVQLRWDERDLSLLGTSLERHRTIRDARILVLGTSARRGIEDWRNFRPRSIDGADFAAGPRLWRSWLHHAPSRQWVLVQARQGTLLDLPAGAFDVIACDAALDRVGERSALLDQCDRLLALGGLFAGRFGPNWYSWGGDGLSGRTGLRSGFNHLILEPREYVRFVQATAESPAEEFAQLARPSEHLRPRDYLDLLRFRWHPLSATARISHDAVAFRAHAYDRFRSMLRRHGLAEGDALVSGLDVSCIKLA